MLSYGWNAKPCDGDRKGCDIILEVSKCAPLLAFLRRKRWKKQASADKSTIQGKMASPKLPQLHKHVR